MPRTQPRQVRLVACSLFSPGLENRVAAESSALVKEYGISLLSHIQQIDIYESIFDNTITGSVTLVEDVGLIEAVPIIGVEFLWIAFEVDDDTTDDKIHKFEHMFRVTKVKDVSYPRHEHRMFTMELATQEFVTSVSHRISRKYDKKTCKEAAVDIMSRDLDIPPTRLVAVEDTNAKVTITIPNYTPLQAINFFTLLSQTKDKKESNFVFFETLKGFHFTSIAKLITDGLKEIEKADHRVYRLNPGQVTGVMATDEASRNSVMRLFQDQTFDALVDIASGKLRSQMIHFDFLARKLEVTEASDSKYTDTFKKTTHLAKDPLHPVNAEQALAKNVRTFTFPTNVWSVAGSWWKGIEPDTPEQKLYEAIVLHNRQMKEITSVQTLIEMPGHPEIEAGSVMDLWYPSTRILEQWTGPKTTAVVEKATPLMSGPHLVTSVRHLLIPQGNGQLEYRMHLKVCKDSYGKQKIAFQSGEKYA